MVSYAPPTDLDQLHNKEEVAQSNARELDMYVGILRTSEKFNMVRPYFPNCARQFFRQFGLGVVLNWGGFVDHWNCAPSRGLTWSTGK